MCIQLMHHQAQLASPSVTSGTCDDYRRDELLCQFNNTFSHKQFEKKQLHTRQHKLSTESTAYYVLLYGQCKKTALHKV